MDEQPPEMIIKESPPNRGRDELAYLLPMGAFLAFIWAGGHWPAFYPISYVLRTVAAGVLLILFWRHYTPIRWTHWKLGLAMGVIGVVQWVGMEKGLLWLAPNYPRMSAAPFDPVGWFSNSGLMWAWLAVRWFGPVLVVPFMEELFWRDFLWRTIQAPNDFKLADVGEKDWMAAGIVTLLFASVHIQWLTAIVWGLMIAWLLIKTRSLGACILMHATTNFLLGGFVLFSHFVLGRNEWYFW
jgi:CAAX prenyl protease-like protein